MLEPFLIRAIIAGIGVAIIAGIIGCFVVWRKMAYFGDSLAHSALLGVALGLVFGISTNLGTIIICSIFTISLIWLQQKNVLATDTLLGILAHSALSVGMVVLSILERSIDLHSYLFGDILAVTIMEIYLVMIGGIFVLIILSINWQSFVLTTINEKLAKAEISDASPILCSHGDVISELIRSLTLKGMSTPKRKGFAKASVWELSFSQMEQ